MAARWLIVFNARCLALHDESLAEALAIQSLLLQFEFELANVLMTLVVRVLILLVLELVLLDAPDRSRHLLAKLGDHLIRLGA